MLLSDLIKPTKLEPGDTVAVISPSWAGASVYPERYLAGKKQLEEEFGLKVVEAPNTLISAEENFYNPKKRVDDLHWALTNKDVKAIIPMIGGENSISTFSSFLSNVPTSSFFSRISLNTACDNKPRLRKIFKYGPFISLFAISSHSANLFCISAAILGGAM